MWPRRNVSTRSEAVLPLFPRGWSPGRAPFAILLLLLWNLALLVCPFPAAAEELITEVVLNSQDKGQFFVRRDERGTFFLKPEDLTSIGLIAPAPPPILIEGEAYQPLEAIGGIRYTFDEATLTLSLVANPNLLAKSVIDFLPKPPQKVYRPSDSSLFLNYAADYLTGAGPWAFNLTNQLGARNKEWLFITDSDFTRSQNQQRLVRLQTSLIRDDRKELTRLTVGDLSATSGELGSTLNLGGVGFSKNFGIDPYFISYPTLNVTGQAMLPSEAKIYLNGVLLRSEKLAPGVFELKNLVPYGAAGALDIVLKDQFGKEQRLSYPFYYAGPSLLQKGLNEYSYNVGFLRQEFGTQSFRYSDPAFSGFHRYGISDSVTAGFRAEGKGDAIDLGPQASFLLRKAGLAHFSLAASAQGGLHRLGEAGLISYLYQGVHVGFNLSRSMFSREYTVLIPVSQTVPVKATNTLGVSYTDRALGTLSLSYSATSTYQGPNPEVITTGYTRNLTNQISLTLNYTKVKQSGSSDQYLLLLSYTPKRDLYVSTSYQGGGETSALIAGVQKNPPVGEGFGYRLNGELLKPGEENAPSVDASLEYNGRHGIYLAETTRDLTGSSSQVNYHFSASGSLVYLGDRLAASRPVSDSFGLVKVGDLPGVPVFLNAQEIGTTDPSGEIIVPNLGSFFNNELSISDKAIPMDYYLPEVKKLVSPPLRSGSCIPFVVQKMQPISGELGIRSAGRVTPVEYQEFSLNIHGQTYTVPTGKGGAFDIDLGQSPEFAAQNLGKEIGCQALKDAPTSVITPGAYQGTLFYQGRTRNFTVTIPQPSGPATDLGMIVIDANK